MERRHLIIRLGQTLSARRYKSLTAILLIVFYIFLFYLVWHDKTNVDFLSFYISSYFFDHVENPYLLLMKLPLTHALVAANLNPPLFFFLFRPLGALDYSAAFFLWSFLSFFSGLIGAKLAFNEAFTQAFIQKNKFYLYLIYLISFPTLMNVGLGQLGLFLLGGVMLGYWLYKRHYNIAAGLVWGFLAALKYFPLIFLFYILIQKRYKALLMMFFAFVGFSFLPLLYSGVEIYQHYFSMMSLIRWYGKSWNASILGLLVRLFFSEEGAWHGILFVYGFLLCSFFLLYIKKIQLLQRQQREEKAFALTLVSMLLLSPFGWQYYFTLLVFPFAYVWKESFSHTLKRCLWYLSLVLCCFPLNNIPLFLMPTWGSKLSLYSFPFYGLLLLFSLLCYSPGLIKK